MKRIMMWLLLAGYTTSCVPEAQVLWGTTQMNITEWDTHYFVPLTHDNKKLVILIVQSMHDVLSMLKRGITAGPDAFLEALFDLITFQYHHMDIFLPSQQDLEA